MNTCQARKGFLTLSSCGNPGVKKCSQCQRPTCEAHLAPRSGFSMCFDCAAPNSSLQEGEYDDVWSHRYRNSYYASTGYMAMDWSSRHDYDQQDARSFDERERDAADDEAGRGGFGES
jgi:hypothetical protein